MDRQIEKFASLLLRNSEDISVLLAYAEANLRRGRRLEALQAYQKVMNLKPDVLEVHLGMAKIYAYQKMYSEAYHELLRVFELSPGNIEGHLLYNRLLDESRLPDDLQESFLPYAEFEAEIDDVRLSKHQLLLEREMLDQEIQDLEKLLSENQDEPIIEYNYEMAKIRKREQESALEELIQWEEILLEHERKMAAEKEAVPLLEVVPIEVPPIVEVPPVAEEPVVLKEAVLPQPAPVAEEVLEPVGEELAEERISPAREEFYARIRESVESVLSGLIKTKGVSAVLVLARDKYAVCSILRESIDETSVSSLICRGLEVINPFWERKEGPLAYWVLEFEKGILVVQSISPDYVLVAIGQAGANFGVMRYSIDKSKDHLNQILSAGPSLT